MLYLQHQFVKYTLNAKMVFLPDLFHIKFIQKKIMTENISPLRTINELLEYSFFIPSYQRGYRWDSQQVEDLLNDIDKFDPKEIKDSWYCLQPLVVKHCNTECIEAHRLDSNENWYEVIDGQQRLTTIFLIVHYINEMWKGKQKLKEFNLKYQTREKGCDFLKGLQIDEGIDSIKIDTSNIDFYHISLAYDTIHSWVKSRKNFNTGEFESKFIHYTKIIWYESIADSIDIFTRINMGKIRLTNAELIKALFLNFKKEEKNEENEEKIRLKQLEIASEWDRIEYALQNNAFWYFLNKGTNSLTNRIEYIFNLMVLKDKKMESLPKDDELFTFRYFNDKFKNKTDKEITDNWQAIKKIYQILEEWFEDRELYHKIGFLVTADIEIISLIIAKENSNSKTAFLNYLNGKIKDKVSVLKDKASLPLEELVYGKHNSAIKNILLLHNIQTILDSDNKHSRFPFDIYNNKEENWDIEHIHPVTEQMPKTEKHQQEWLKETSKLIKDDEALRIKTEIYKKEAFEGIYQEILNHFSESKKHEDINDLSNLALLNAKINRGYGNAVFLDKRNEIIENDKKGTFIPLCTKNIFMKYYTDDIEQITFWGENDRVAYLNNIKITLNSPTLKIINDGQ